MGPAWIRSRSQATISSFTPFDLMSVIPPAFRLPTLLCIWALSSLSVLSPASAVVVTVNGTQYDLDVFEGPYLGNESLFSSIAPGEMPWWGDENKAIDFASQVFDQLLEGTTLGNSPLFAYEVVDSDVNGWSSDILSPNSLYFESFDTGESVKYVVGRSLSTGVSSVPGPLPIFGAAAAFSWSRRIRRRLSQ
jgi:hypothetical protein